MVGHPLNKLVVIALATGLFCLHADAQSLLPDRLQQAVQSAQGSDATGHNSQPPTVILQPQTQQNQQLPISRLERIMSGRAGVKLKQFGYDQLGVARAVSIAQMGAVQDDYILGPGDEIVVTLRGQENAEYRMIVDRNGRVVLPRMSPFSAAGRTLRDFRQDLVAAIHRAYISTEGYVSVGRVRQINVLVSGEVNTPGTRILTGLSTPVDAILISGGIKKSGSLRNVYIQRGDRRLPIDLYSVLTGQGEASHVSLADGDRIVVPPLGPTVAIAGWVRRPGIFEIGKGRSSIDAKELFGLAGGLEVRGKYLISLLKIGTDGRDQMVPLDRERGVVTDSEVVLVQPGANETVDQMTLSGGTPLAGQYATRNTKISEILKAPGALGKNPYTLFGVISRRDPLSLMRTLTPFTPVAVLKGSEDMDVRTDDIVRILSAREAQMLFLTVREYEERRALVENEPLNPESRLIPGMEPQSGTTSTQTGTTTQSQQTMQGGSRNYAPQQEDLASETEAESLVYVEHQIEMKNRRANGEPAYGSYGRQSSSMGQGLNAQQNQNTQQGSGFGQDDYSYQGMNSTQGMPNELQQNTLNRMQYPAGAQNQEQQQIGPYRDPRGSYEPPTLAGNLEEQPLSVGQIPTNQDVTKASQIARQLNIDPVAFINFLRDHKVMVGGAVREAGIYLVGPDADLNSLLQAAGGLARWADKSSIEVISTRIDSRSGTAQTRRKKLSLADAEQATFLVAPRDEVHVNQIFTDVGVGQVVVQGQVRNAGTYQIMRGEHLSDVLMRAGGLTESAYPYGTVFLRRSVAAQEKAAFRREADELETQLMIAMSRRDPTSKLSPDAFTALQSYVNQLRYQRALGRITVVADPVLLASNPSLDPLLEAGDVVYIPQRPFAVSVFGEVLQPGSVPFRSNMSAADYVAGAGGYSQFADKAETFLVLPDGTARRVGSSWFDFAKFSSDAIPPGSTIFVARDVSGYDLHEIIVSTTQIFTQLATSAAALAVLSKQ